MNKKVTLNEIILELGLVIFIFSFISYLYNSNVLLTLILLFAWGTGIYFWHTRRDITIFIVAAILGPIVEIIAINLVYGHIQSQYLQTFHHGYP